MIYNDFEKCVRESNRHYLVELGKHVYPDLPDDTEIVVTQSNPFRTYDGQVVILSRAKWDMDEYTIRFTCGKFENQGHTFLVFLGDTLYSIEENLG